MRLLLVRHALSEHVSRDIIADIAGCPGLAPAGFEQAKRVAARLAAVTGLIVLLSSPVLRARQTAEAVASALGAEIIERGDLRELVPGAADGMTRAAYRETYGEFDLIAEPERPFSPGGESWNGFLARVKATFAGLAETYPDRTVVAVTHAGFIVAAMKVMLNSPTTGQEAFLKPTNTGLTEWRHEAGRWFLTRYNDASHLDAAG